MKHSSHDEFFGYLFSLTAVVRDFIRVFIPPKIVGLLDLDTLTPDDTRYLTDELAEL
jgi:hypothetical protein